MQYVPLTRGQTAVVDDSDADRVMAFSWVARPSTRGKWYACRTFGRATVYMHRFILAAPSGFYVDHIDGDGLNNTRSNLRLCTPSENLANRRYYEPASGYRGVYELPHCREPWQAEIFANGKRRKLGRFLTREDAARAYDAAAIEAYGEFATLNFSQENINAE